jgi:hypothetical protein
MVPTSSPPHPTPPHPTPPHPTPPHPTPPHLGRDSPNGFWAIIALVTYFAFPYDLSPGSAAALAPFSWAFFKLRFPIWFTMTFGYNTFWHVTLYLLRWGKRPFVANRPYNINKVWEEGRGGGGGGGQGAGTGDGGSY